MTTKLHDFRLASHGHLAGAKAILEDNGTSTRGSLPAKSSSSAAYLAGVALECSIKAKLLARGAYESTEALKRKLPLVHKALFKSKDGHDLGKLARELRLMDVIRANGKNWEEDNVWKRMSSPERPYSLRYGSEHLTAKDAESEVARARELSETLLSGLSTASTRRSRP
ncbi:MAG: hypothetical protein IPI49_31025 [Myxococcales bacterium]|nr:hypothetical protein [Myxococcales bacterium]